MKTILNFFFLTTIFTGCQLSGQNVEIKEASDIKVLIDRLPANGGKIELPEGVFIIDKMLTLKDNVWLQGSGSGTVLQVEDSIGVYIGSFKGVRVSDLSLKRALSKNARIGILLSGAGDCKVENILTQGFEKYGIALTDDAFLCKVNSCVSADNGQANFYFGQLAAGGRGGDFVPNLVSNSISYGVKNGFELNHAIVLNITGCSVFQPLGYGFYLHNTSNSVNISGSRTFQVELDAVYIDNSHEVNVSSNIFCWHRGHGIVLSRAKWGTVSANNFIDNGVLTRDGSYKNGVVMKNNSQGIQVTGNAIFNWGDQAPMENGINEDTSCSFNLITNNNINYYLKEGVVSGGRNSIANNNLMKGDSAFVGMDRPVQYPDFDTLKIIEFLKL